MLVDVDGRAKHDGKCKLGGNEVGGNEVDDNNIIEEKNYQKTSKYKKLSKSKKMKSGFFTLGARLAFIKLRQMFVKALILHHFDPKHYI